MRQLKITKLKKIRREPKDKEYEKEYFEARNIYRNKCSENYKLRLFIHRMKNEISHNPTYFYVIFHIFLILELSKMMQTVLNRSF